MPGKYPERVSVPAVAFFDLDKTVIATSSTLAFGRRFFAHGLINRRAMLKGAYAQVVYMLGGADDDQMARMRDDLARMVAGWDVSQVNEIVAETLHGLIQPLVYAEAARLIDEHHEAGREVVIVSSSGIEVVGPIGEMLGADHVIATRMVVEDGRYSGEVDFYAAGPAKADAIRALADDRGYDLAASYAYSDSVSDVPMLEAVGRPHAVNPDRALRREAARRGWPVLEFRHPVPLRSRMGRMAPPRRPLLVVIVGAASFGALRLVRRRMAGRRPHPTLPVTGRSQISGLGKPRVRR
jgi:HAD superfamily hydrolase (TIGR01490 family)